MGKTKNFLGFDIGASGGKALLGKFDGERLCCEEVCRFPNKPVSLISGIHWNVLSLFEEIKGCLSSYRRENSEPLSSIAIDTWGLDFGLIDSGGKLMGSPFHYRDTKNRGMAEEIIEIMGRYNLYRTSGIHLCDMTTLSQLYSLKKMGCPQLKIAEKLLMMPALLSYLLSGETVSECSIMTPTGLYEINKNDFAEEVFNKLGLSSQIMCNLAEAGTVLGRIRNDIAAETGVGDIPVIVPAMHDSASATIGVPAGPGNDWAFISSGTWCIAGIETEKPVICRQGYDAGISNTGIEKSRYMFTGYMTGLWLLQECKRVWESRGEKAEYNGLVELAEKAPAFYSFIDVEDSRFAGFTDMPAAIMDYCSETGQRRPSDKGTLTRIIIEGIVFKQKEVLETIKDLSGRKYRNLHILGGGIKNHLFCQFTSNATGIPVLAGPGEGAGLGNIITQMIADGSVSSIEEGREVIKKSVPLETYLPREEASWEEAYHRYKATKNKTRNSG